MMITSAVLRLFVVLCCLIFPVLTWGANDALTQIKALIEKHGFSTNGIAIYIREALDDNTTIAALNENKPLNPASVIKLLTTLVALDQMGAGYRWQNELYYSGAVKNGTLTGDLYFRGNGDPYLTPERFWLLLNKLYIEGIHRINGNVYFDDSYFQPEPIDYAAFDNQPYRSYHVGPNAVLVGFQSTELHFSMNNGALDIVPFPNTKYITIVNQVKISRQAACGRWEKGVQVAPVIERDTLQVKISGMYPASCQHKTMYRRLSDTKHHFQLYFEPIWRQIGGSVTGEFQQRKVPENATALFEEPSISLSEAIRFINKFSNNVMTRQVLLSLGAFKNGAPGTTAKGIRSIEQWLDDKIVTKAISDRKSLVLDNGAGLSRDTRISAKLLGELLGYAYKQAYMPDYLASLPISGYDLTMAKRFDEDELTGKIYMKTGLLDFVQTMAGYVNSASGKRYIVVMLHNDNAAHTKKAAELQEAILRWVYQL